MSLLRVRRVFLCVSSFIAESEQLKDQWVEAMRDSIGEALSNSEVAEQIWAEPSNGYCADCGATKPEWASINLCVVVCKRCAGMCVCVVTTTESLRG